MIWLMLCCDAGRALWQASAVMMEDGGRPAATVHVRHRWPVWSGWCRHSGGSGGIHPYTLRRIIWDAYNGGSICRPMYHHLPFMGLKRGAKRAGAGRKGPQLVFGIFSRIRLTRSRQPVVKFAGSNGNNKYAHTPVKTHDLWWGNIDTPCVMLLMKVVAQSTNLKMKISRWT